ncbi:MAG: sigma-54-dependent Fis family transcriptional regulator [Desulfobacteraceae bacterium]|nr:MAG: sigma-54-dependent Fis family transcriptional regulator [Desulfobacteraceae bacterium]
MDDVKIKTQEDLQAAIMVIDDDPITLKNLRSILEKVGHSVSTFRDPIRALKSLDESPCDLVISDVRMPGLDGLSVMERIKGRFPHTEIILITGFASIDGAVDATKRGAYHYLSKPFTPEELRRVVSDAVREKTMREQAEASVINGPVIIGDSLKIREIEDLILKIAPLDCNVLITGDSGTGKELVARSIHSHSSRADKPFVAFNCGGFSEDLIANELFGHEKDAFTGARSRKIGIIETANKGTLFLDEVGEMPLSMQVKLLRVLQERELMRVGGVNPVPLDIRVVAATARELKVAAAEGVFRQDLYFRLNVINIAMPRLSERKEDIPLLVYHFLYKFQRRTGKAVKAVSAGAMNVLSSYAYPGNVRELENIMERALALCDGNTIQIRDLPPDLGKVELYYFDRPDSSLMTLEELERDYIRHILVIAGGVKSDAARILGIDRVSLWRRMKKHGLE